MNNKPLKPCPFCGGRASLIKKQENTGFGCVEPYVIVLCEACQAQTRKFFDLDEEWAREMWNMRTDIPEAYIVTGEIPNCTIHILRDPVTGAESWGWRRNE